MSVSDTDWSILMTKLANFEHRLQQLEKDVVHFANAAEEDTKYILQSGSLSDPGLPQQWRESISSNQDCEE